MMMKIQVKAQRILVVSVSIIIITHGREELLTKCLESLRPLGQSAQLILVANGKELSPSLLSVANSLTQDVTVVPIANKALPGHARNLGLKLVKHEWIYFIDDDAFWLPGYDSTLFPLLSDPKIEVLGGPDSPAPNMGWIATSLAIALSSPFCTGGTFARHRSLGQKLVRSGEEKLTSCNLWVRKSALGNATFPEDYRRTEENQFLQKLIKQNASLFYHPHLKVAHYRRNNLFDMLKPGFNTGVYRSRLMREKINESDPIFWLPSVFVLLHLTVFFDLASFLYLTKIYLGMILLVSLGLSSQRGKIVLFPIVAFLHHYIVFLFGLGFMYERLTRWR